MARRMSKSAAGRKGAAAKMGRRGQRAAYAKKAANKKK